MPIRHIARDRECIASIAFENGHFLDTIWNDPANAALKELRRDPYLLVAGDVVIVPDLRPKQLACATGKRHTFRRVGVPEKLTLQLADEDDQPFANRGYTLTIEGVPREGVTDADGVVDVWIAPNASRGEIALASLEGESAEELVWPLAIGGLDPADDAHGVAARLVNLGWNSGAELVSGEAKQFELALRSFQEAHALEPTGLPDDATLDKLREQYGS